MAAVSQPPSGLDTAPTVYLALPRFNHSLDFDFEVGHKVHKATVTYALTDAPPAASWPILVFFNGLGGRRLIAAMIEGIAREHHVQILRPHPRQARRWGLFFLHAHSPRLPHPLDAHRPPQRPRTPPPRHHHLRRPLAPTASSTRSTLSSISTPHFTLASISGAVALRLPAALPALLMPNAMGAMLQVV